MNELYIVMYHYTRYIKGSRYPAIKGMELSLFREQVNFFKEKFNIATMEQVIDAVEGNSRRPEHALLLTFDDGYIDNYTFAFPILEEAGIQGSFFVSGKALGTGQLLDVNKIHYILACADINKLLADVMERINYYRGVEYDFPPKSENYKEIHH